MIKKISENRGFQFLGDTALYMVAGASFGHAVDIFRELQWRGAIIYLFILGLSVWLGWRAYWSYRKELEKLRANVKQCPKCGHSASDD